MAYVPSVSFDEYKKRVDYYMGYRSKPKHELTCKIPSLWWECAGIYTLYMLACTLVYLTVG